MQAKNFVLMCHYVRDKMYLCLNVYAVSFVIFGLVGFYGISTIVGYLKPYPLYTYVSDI